MRRIVICLGLGLLLAAGCRVQTRDEPVREQERAPNFTLADHTGERITLTRELAAGPVLLVFYRGHW